MIYLSLALLTAVAALVSNTAFISRWIRWALLFVLFLWYFIPGAILTVFDLKSVTALQAWYVSDEEYEMSFFVETLAISMVVVCFLYARSRIFGVAVNRERIRIPGDRQIYVFISLFILVQLFEVSLRGFDYLTRNSMDTLSGGTGFFLVSVLRNLLMSFVILAGIEAPRGRKVIPFAYAALVAYTLITLYIGSRIGLLLPLVFLLIRFTDPRRITFRNIVMIAFLMVLALAVLMPVALKVQQQRTQTLHETPLQMSPEEIARTLFVKFDSVSAGSALVRHDGYGTAGLMPYAGSLLVFVPRAIWPDRPVAGTADGTLNTHPSRFVPYLVLNEVSDSFNVGVSPVHVTMWQFGAILGFLVFVLAGTLFLVYVDSLLISPNFEIRTIGIWLISIPTFHLLVASPDIIVKQLVISLVLVVFITKLNERKFAT
jgi:hypothetical protein